MDIDLIDLLDQENLSLLIFKNCEPIFTSKEGGVLPLIKAIETLDSKKLSGSTIVDKIVGKAAALLTVHAKMNEVHAKILSKRAIPVFERFSIPYYYENLVEEIKNKDGTGICIFEGTVLEIEDPEEAFQRLKAKVQSLKAK